MAVDDQYTKLLLHGEGKEGWNFIYDEAGKTATPYGTACTKSANKKFGTRALNFTNTSNEAYLTIPANADFNVGSGDFTIDCWFAFSRLFTNNSFSTDGYKILFSQRQGHQWNESMNLAVIKRSTGYRVYYWYTLNGSSQVAVESSDLVFEENTLYHVAVVRNSTEIKLYLDGVCVATHTIGTGSIYESTALFIIAGGAGMDPRVFWEGSIDEFRFSKGIARWTEDFTPPTEQYGTPDPFDWDVFDEYTTFLSHFDNPAIKDELYSPLTVNSNAALSTLQKKFGVASLSLDGNGDYVSAAFNSLRFGFGTGDFTMETWVYLNAMPAADGWPTSWSSHMSVMGVGTPNAGDGCNMVLGATKLYLNNSDSGYFGNNHGMTTGQWYHLAITRSGNVWRAFVDGIKIGEFTNAMSAGAGSNFYIGCETGQGAWLNGYIDELRVSKGIARWTSNFTPPTAAYGPSAPVSTGIMFATFI